MLTVVVVTAFLAAGLIGTNADNGIPTTPEELEQLRQDSKKEFDEIDLDKNGYIDPEEFATNLRQDGIDEVDIQAHVNNFFETEDSNFDGKISFEEIFKLSVEALDTKVVI